MKAEFFFDPTCPWCYLGQVRFMRALQMRPNLHVDVRWNAFLLHPDVPLDGVDRQAYLIRKFGGLPRVNRLTKAVMAACQAEGITIHFERVKRLPNAVHSHRFIKFAAHQGLVIPAVETIFAAYFKHGIDIGNIDELIELGAELGLDEIQLAHYLYSDTDIATILGDNSRALRLGVSGVPCVVLADKFAISGAQESHILVKLLDVAYENQTELQAIQR